MSEELPWHFNWPMVKLLRRLPSIIDNKRFQVEFEALRKYTHGVHEDDLLEAVHRMVVDLLDSGHTPSQDMLRMIGGELKAVWWPDRAAPAQQRVGVPTCVQREINFWAGKKYGNARRADGGRAGHRRKPRPQRQRAAQEAHSFPHSSQKARSRIGAAAQAPAEKKDTFSQKCP
jgi:hypothetical protein